MLAAPEKQRIEHISNRAAAAAAFDKLVLCRVLGTFKMLLPVGDDGIAPHLALDGCHRTHVTAALWRLLEPGMRVVDVGAHVGYLSLLAASVVGPQGMVYSFEPNKNLFGCLRRNVRMNGFDDRVTAVRKAVATYTGEGTFRYHSQHQSSGTMCSGTDWGDWDVCTVAITKLDQAVPFRPDLLIIDAEGYEPQVLEGARSLIEQVPIGPTIMIEWHPKRYASPRVRSHDLVLELFQRISVIDANGGEQALTPEQFTSIDKQCTLILRRHPGGA